VVVWERRRRGRLLVMKDGDHECEPLEGVGWEVEKEHEGWEGAITIRCLTRLRKGSGIVVKSIGTRYGV